MAVLAWLVAPLLADRFSGDRHVPMANALIVSLAVGMVWQFVLVAMVPAPANREFGTVLADTPELWGCSWGARPTRSHDPRT